MQVVGEIVEEVIVQLEKESLHDDGTSPLLNFYPIGDS